MGKKARRTRWRALTITGELSDSEESNTPTSHKKYGEFPYSSQSTPTRRYQYDGTKSTRSSSTTSENKITFNEDEYTRITTPRQDVLFKKGYLNRPKSYQTQTSTGTSTTSTTSTGNGTPDHQSTDLEYESQFVFPNGFVDQNGIYYVNSFEPYPLMVFNPPTYFQEELSHAKTKRSSTGSLTESTSPHNEEASQSDADDSRRIKKKRRRRPSRSKSLEDAATSDDDAMKDADDAPKVKYDLKPDAEEFIPRAYREAPVQFIPVPLVEFNGAAFIPPVNFIPQNFFVEYENPEPKEEEPKNQIDIAKIVSKLEEAAKEQNEDKKETTKRNTRRTKNYSDTLKKNVVTKIVVKETKEVKAVKPNQWISVSRKKRKNRGNFEEMEDFEPVDEEKDLFESYDVAMLEDVVLVPAKVEEIIPKPEENEEIEIEKPKKKKKAKNPKRVIITDVDLTAEEKVEEKTEEEKPIVEEKVVEEEKIVEEEKKVETESKSEKKTKKKKKKTVKNNEPNGDSYDFLLEKSLDESLEKTNLEVSQELDKMIQRGMYSNLEEKIKSLQIEPPGDFFKTVISNISSRESSVEKTPECIFQPRPKSVNLEPVRADCNFLGETTPTKTGGGGNPPESRPITAAVKNWMEKTREANVEILKSPSAIYREFYDSDDEGERVVPKHGDLPYRAICCSIV